MRLPKRVADIIKRKQAFIDSQRDKLENSIVRLQSDLFNSIISELIPELDVKDGIIQDTPKNYRLISVLDKTYKDFQSVAAQIQLTQIVGTTSNIASLSKEYYGTLLFKEGVPLTEILQSKFDKIVLATQERIDLQIGLKGDKVFKGGWLDSFFNSNTVGLDLKKITSQAITSNLDRKDLTKILKEKITGTPEYKGSLERQFNMYTYDLYQQYDAAYNLLLGNEFGFEYFIYQGGLIEDSRDFCAAHNGKVWHIDDMKTWKDWTPSQGEYPEGYEVKQKDIYAIPSYLGYAGYDPGLNRGGYHCRHAFGWIPKEIAIRMNPQLEEN